MCQITHRSPSRQKESPGTGEWHTETREKQAPHLVAIQVGWAGEVRSLCACFTLVWQGSSTEYACASRERVCMCLFVVSPRVCMCFCVSVQRENPPLFSHTQALTLWGVYAPHPRHTQHTTASVHKGVRECLCIRDLLCAGGPSRVFRGTHVSSHSLLLASLHTHSHTDTHALRHSLSQPMCVFGLREREREGSLMP